MASEKRLIDANELLSVMRLYDERQKTDMWETSEVEYLLKELSTVDAEPVKHGRWNESDWSGINVAGYMACSNCNVMIPKPDNNYYCLARLRYCPNCGAKMDGDGNA